MSEQSKLRGWAVNSTERRNAAGGAGQRLKAGELWGLSLFCVGPGPGAAPTRKCSGVFPRDTAHAGEMTGPLGQSGQGPGFTLRGRWVAVQSVRLGQDSGTQRREGFLPAGSYDRLLGVCIILWVQIYVTMKCSLEKEMATHSSVFAWRIPGTGEPGELPSMGSHRVGHD